MVNLVTYVLAALSNFAVVLLLPGGALQSFLKLYSVSSMLAGMLIVYLFSSSVAVPWLSKRRKAILAAFFFMLITAAFCGFVGFLIVLYCVSVLLADYYSSQSVDRNTAYIQRLLIFSGTLPLCFFQVTNVFPFEYFLLLRIVPALTFLILVKRDDLMPLRLKGASVYVVLTHVLYFGCLTILPWVASGSQLRTWYISTQVGQSLVLKASDYVIRGWVGGVERVSLLASIVCIGLGAAVFMLVGGWVPFVVYLIGAVLLLLVVRSSITA